MSSHKLKTDETNNVKEDISAVSETGSHRKLPLSRRILSVVWDSLDKLPKERKFINKVDCWIMSYVCMAYFVKYLDQTNVSCRSF